MLDDKICHPLALSRNKYKLLGDKSLMMLYVFTHECWHASLVNDINGLRENLIYLYISEIFICINEQKSKIFLFLIMSLNKSKRSGR